MKARARTCRISPTSGRVYYSATNIKQLYGPSIAKEMLKETTPDDFKENRARGI